MELQHKVYIEKRDTSILLSTTQLQGQVLNAIPELGTVSLPTVPNWLQSPLKPRAQLCMEVVSSRDDHQPRVDKDENKIEQDPRWIVLRVWNRVLVSAAKLRWPELSQLSLCSAFDKENSIELPLDFLHYLYKCLTLTLYQSPTLPYESLLSCVSIDKKNKRKEKEKNIKYWLSHFAKS